MIPDPEALRERWERMQRWEDEQMSGRPLDGAAALAWLGSARDLASRMDPDWGSPTHAEAHWRHLSDVQSALARVRFSR